IKGVRFIFSAILLACHDAPRLHIANYPHHIVQRGHNRAACFFADEDYQTYRHWLGEALAKTGAALHAYVLMTNHVHLLLTPKAAAHIPRLVMAIGRRYVQTINKTYRRKGTLWDRWIGGVAGADGVGALSCLPDRH
ncbi:MAG: transposase, partial [Lamprobacter sp.]|uniref:transposase n=1 Tax=Lamprobacter sp. TaxID=3100796 RepID=UPI002B261CF8